MCLLGPQTPGVQEHWSMWTPNSPDVISVLTVSSWWGNLHLCNHDNTVSMTTNVNKLWVGCGEGVKTSFILLGESGNFRIAGGMWLCGICTSFTASSVYDVYDRTFCCQAWNQRRPMRTGQAAPKTPATMMTRNVQRGLRQSRCSSRPLQ